MTVEIWEKLIPGDVWLIATNDRGQERTVRVTGAGARVRVTVADRELLEMTRASNNPFSNGAMRRIEPPDERTEGIYSDMDMEALLHSDLSEFMRTATKMSELNARRLLKLATEDQTVQVGHVNWLKDMVVTRWVKQGAMPSYSDPALKRRASS